MFKTPYRGTQSATDAYYKGVIQIINQYLQKQIDDSYKILALAAEMSKEYYQKPLVICYSGGKDSDVLLQLAIECLCICDFEVINSHTTVDAPETVYHIRDKFKELEKQGVKTTVIYPRDKNGELTSMWKMIPEKQIPPTRLQRYCCKELKELSTPNRIVAVGVREAESMGRRGRASFATRGKNKASAYYFDYEHTIEVFNDDKERRGGGIDANQKGAWDCTLISNMKDRNDIIVNAIYKWRDIEIWDFIHDRNIKYNPLYDKGYKRVGCIGCPLSSERTKEFVDYPKYKELYIKAFDRMIKRRKEAGKDYITGKSGYHVWDSGAAVFEWWTRSKDIKGQMLIDDFFNNDN